MTSSAWFCAESLRCLKGEAGEAGTDDFEAAYDTERRPESEAFCTANETLRNGPRRVTPYLVLSKWCLCQLQEHRICDDELVLRSLPHEALQFNIA